MLLQIDATILYALQKRKSQVLLVDLQVESKYNTYKYNGLPPTPISGFGERSIIAILNAPQSDFIYYLLTDKSGKMSFTNNYTDFINMYEDERPLDTDFTAIFPKGGVIWEV